MATSVSLGYATWLDGGTYNGQLLRCEDVAALTYGVGSSTAAAVLSGVLPAGGAPALQVNAATGMNITINPGYCVVANSTSNLQGAYRFGTQIQQTLTVTTSDPTNARIDIVCAQVVDNGNNTSFAELIIVAGTPASSPSPPATPANAIVLAQITVPHSATNIVAPNISDQRVYTTAPGGIVPIASLSAAPAAQYGQYAHDLTVGRLVHLTPSGPAQAHILPWTPAITYVAGPVQTTGSGTETTVASVTFSANGSTDVDIMWKWAGFTFPSSPANCTVHQKIYLDGVQIDRVYTSPPNSLNSTDGGSAHHYTSAAIGDTPTNGSHTITWTITAFGTGNTVQLNGDSQTLNILRVAPVVL